MTYDSKRCFYSNDIPEVRQVCADLVRVLNEERKRLNITGDELEDLTGISRNTWCSAVRDGRTRLCTLIRVAQALDVEITLVNREGVNIL